MLCFQILLEFEAIVFDQYMSKVSPSHIVFAALITELVRTGRKIPDSEEHPVLFVSFEQAMAAMSYLSSAAYPLGIRQHTSFTEMSLELKQNSCLDDDFIDKLYRIVDFPDIYSFETFVQSCSAVFEHDSNVDVNDVIAPIKICPDSVLGLFIRTFVLMVETLSFEHIGLLFDSHQAYLRTPANKTNNIVMETEIRYLVGHLDNLDELHTGLSEPFERMVFEACKTYHLGDVRATEDIFHKIFDYNGEVSDKFTPIQLNSKANNNANNANNSKSKNADYLIHSSLQSMRGALFEPELSAGRYQQAMLCLSILWARLGYTGKARLGVEEALRIAHQKGDHASIAQAMLLLYHIGSPTGEEPGNNQSSTINDSDTVNRIDYLEENSELSFHDLSDLNKSLHSQEMSSSMDESVSEEERDPKDIIWDIFNQGNPCEWDGEDLLLRCLDRSSSLTLSILSCQASILLCQLRSKGILCSDISKSLTNSSSSSSNSLMSPLPLSSLDEKISELGYDFDKATVRAPRSTKCSIQILWTFLTCCSFGDSKLNAALCKQRDISSIDNVLATLWTDNSSNNNHLLPTQQQANANDESAIPISEANPIVSHAKMIAAEMWVRFGAFDMALLEFKRLLYNDFQYLPNNTIASFICKFSNTLVSQGQRMCQIYEEHGKPEQGSKVYLSSIETATKIINSAKRLFPTQTLPIFTNSIFFAWNFILCHFHFAKNNSQLAIRHIEKCISIAFGKNWESIFTRMTHENKNNSQLSSFSSYEEEYCTKADMLQLLMMLAKCQESSNLSRCLGIISQIENSVMLEHEIEWYNRIRAYKAQVLVRNNLPLQEEAISIVQDVYQTSSQLGFPSLILETSFNTLLQASKSEK